METIERIAAGRTDLVFEHLDAGGAAGDRDADGVSLLSWAAYYGDVSAMRLLLSRGESLASLGTHALSDAAFHGHWKLCELLLDHGAAVDEALPDTGETPLHMSLCTADRTAHDLVLEVLLARGADTNRATKPGVETGAFMRDVRTRGETPLHRAAAYGSEATIDLLLRAGAKIDAKDAHGDSPLSWASWHLRPTPILRKLCYGNFRIHPERTSLKHYVLGRPLP